MFKIPSKAKAINQSKAKILETAYRLFGERSPEDVSIRELAKEAGVNIASIHYYYGSKEALYLAVVTNITELMAEKYSAFTLAYETALKTSIPSDAFYIMWVKYLIETLARTMLGKLKTNNYLHRILIREQMTPSNGFELLYTKGLEPMLNTLDSLVAHIMHQDSATIEVKARTHALLGSIIVFSVQQSTISQRIPFLGEDVDTNMEIIIRTILENTEYVLQELSRQRK